MQHVRRMELSAAIPIGRLMPVPVGMANIDDGLRRVCSADSRSIYGRLTHPTVLILEHPVCCAPALRLDDGGSPTGLYARP